MSATQEEGVSTGPDAADSPAFQTPSPQSGLDTLAQVSDSVVRTPTAEAPSPEHHPVECMLCGEDFPYRGINGPAPSDALREHMSTVHSHVVNPLGQEANEDESSAPPANGPEAGPSEGVKDLVESIADNRYLQFWNVHDVSQFTKDYRGENDNLPDLWEHTFEGVAQPAAYETSEVEKGEFLPMTRLDVFENLLDKPQARSTDELHVLTANVAKTLQVLQDEYHALAKLRQRAGKIDAAQLPKARKLEDPEVWEDKKESMLYGYKYDGSKNKVGKQDPFIQGGFAAERDSAIKKLHAQTLSQGTRNIDGWTPIVKDGVEYIPMIGRTYEEPKPPKPVPRPRGKRNGPANGGEQRVTRYRGTRRPPTRDVSTSRPSSSQAMRGRGSHRSRGTPRGGRQVMRGRGGTRVGRRRGRSVSTATSSDLDESETSTPSPSASPRPSPLASVAQPVFQPTATAAGPSTSLLARPFANASVELSATPSVRPPSTQEGDDDDIEYEDPLLDPKNQEKIKNSKHPNRTEAMIVHWHKFKSTGRQRKPKRTKAQIEADKAKEGETGSVSAGNQRKRKVGGKHAPIGTSVFSVKKPKTEESPGPGEGGQGLPPIPPPMTSSFQDTA